MFSSNKIVCKKHNNISILFKKKNKKNTEKIINQKQRKVISHQESPFWF